MKALVLGCFDIFHAGHLMLLKQSKNICDELIVGILSDEAVKNKKGENRPIIPLEDRISILNELKCVDHVFVLEKVSSELIRKCVDPDIIIDGIEYKNKKSWWDGKTIYLDSKSEITTSSIIDKIKSLKDA